MKKLLVVAGLASIATAAVAADAPTVYGQVNKEIRYVKQHSRANKNAFTGVVDVQGYETRLGVKGTQKLDNSIGDAVDYNIELGLNSALNDKAAAADERDRIRLANVVLKTAYGNLGVGKMWHSGALRVVAADPFANTSASIANLGDNADLVANTAGVAAGVPVIGAHTRLLNDMIQYGIAWNGFKYVFETDRNDQTDLDKSTGNHRWDTHNLFWDGKVADIDLKASLIYAEDHADFTTKQESYLQSAVQADMANGLGFSLGYGTRDTYSAGYDTKLTVKNMMAAVKYKMNAWTFAATYGSTDLGTKYVTGTTYGWSGDQQGKINQLTIGARHQCGEMVSTTLAYKKLSRKLESNGSLWGAGGKEADADLLIAGITVKF